MWFGGFIHGVMEESFLLWQRDPDPAYRTFPWSYERAYRVQKIVDETRLAPKNIIAPSNQYYEVPDDEEPDFEKAEIANRRAFYAVNWWGPHVFPLVSRPELPLHALREMPPGIANPRARYYEITGVVDVLGSANIRSHADNYLVRELARQQLLPENEDFEIIVDYKGSDRPESDDDLLPAYQWQLETYAWLRSRQRDARPVRAGVLIFLSELEPSRAVLKRLSETARQQLPIPGATPADYEALMNYDPRRSERPELSIEFRMARSLNIYPLDPARVEEGAGRFDSTVRQVERGVELESGGGRLSDTWEQVWRELPTADGTPREAPGPGTCTACDHKTYCRVAIRTYGDDVARVPRP